MKIKQTNAGKNFLFNFQNKNDKNSCTFYINFLWTWNSSIWVRYIIVCWNNTTLQLLNFFCSEPETEGTNKITDHNSRGCT